MYKCTITARLNYRADSEGRYALIIQVIYRRRRSVVTTPYRLRPEEFDAKKGRAVAVNRTKSHRMLIREANRCIETYLSGLRGVAERLQAEGKPYTALDIIGAYKYDRDFHYLASFGDKLVADLETAGRFGTARSYRSLLSVWHKFAHNIRYRFSQLDTRTIASFCDYLERHGSKRNTISFYMRTLRALYNRACRCGYVSSPCNPFREVSFKAAQTPKLAVTRSLLRTLAGRDFGDSGLNEARDMFLFSFYARGMSFVDMCYLRKEKIWDGALHYERQKTHQIFSVTLTSQLREIISRYDDPASPWVLPCMRRGMLSSANKQEDLNGDVPPALLYNFYCMALQYYFALLKDVSRQLDCRTLTFNVARHTWATEARSLGVPMPHISAGLGHTSERTTRIYLASLDNRTVDEVNEKVTRL